MTADAFFRPTGDAFAATGLTRALVLPYSAW